MFFLAMTFAVVWLLIAAFLLYTFIRSKTKEKFLILGAFYFLAIGLVAAYGAYTENKLIAYAGGYLGLAFVALGVAVYQYMQSKEFAKTIPAVYEGYNRYSAFKDIETYKAIFSYEINGQSYREESLTGYSNKAFEKSYQKGQETQVFVSSKNPKHIREQEVNLEKTKTLFILGLMCIALYFVFAFALN